MDSDLISLLVFVAISALSALSNWLQKRKQAAEESELWPPTPAEAPPVPRRATPIPQPARSTSPPASPPKPAPAAPPRMSDWEAELRRLLEGMEKPAAPPPVIVVPAAPSAPPPPPVSTPPPAVLTRPAPSYAQATEEAPEPSRRLAVLQESAEAHAKASRLQENVAVRLRQFERLNEERGTRRTRAAAQVEAAPFEPAVARAWLGDPAGLRQAMIASIVLGPPRSAEL